MKYDDELITNEQQAVKNGERNSVTWLQLDEFLGSDNSHGKLVELALDMLNGIYSPEDCLKDIHDSIEVGEIVK